MKKLIFFSLVTFFSVTLLYGQGVTILPNHEDQITLGDNTFSAKINTRSSWSDFQIRTMGTYPISLSPNQVTGFRINPGGDVGIGSIAAQEWQGIGNPTNKILARLHVYGGSASAKNYYVGGGFWGFKSAVLGEVTKVQDGLGDYNYAGVMGVTDGKNSSPYGFNIGVFSMATSDPAATGQTFNFKGYNYITSNSDAYGSYNYVKTEGSGHVVGNQGYNSSTSGEVLGMVNDNYSNSGAVFGMYNNSNSITGNVFGAYNYLGSSDGEATGVFNEISVGIKSAYGVMNKLLKTGPSSQNIYGNYNDLENSSGGVFGVYNTFGTANSSSSYGIYNINKTISGNSGTVYGVRNNIGGTTGNAYGVYNSLTSNNPSKNRGIYNYVQSNKDAIGIENTVEANYSSPTGQGYGIYNIVSSSNSEGVYGIYSELFNGPGASSNSNPRGIYSKVTNNSTNYSWAYGIQTNVSGTNPYNKYGVYSTVNGDAGTKYGIYSTVGGTDGSVYGIYSTVGLGSGIRYAGYFSGNVHVNGTLTKAGGTFKIDHPLDPENKYLNHSFVESPDMMNIYNGNVVTDNEGNATVELPAYFSALNKDFRYQLTTIGKKSEAWIAEEVGADNTFKISTEVANVKVSWQVTGIRQDAYANDNRVIPEADKPQEEKGTYLYPQGFGKPEAMSLESLHHKDYDRAIAKVNKVEPAEEEDPVEIVELKKPKFEKNKKQINSPVKIREEVKAEKEN